MLCCLCWQTCVGLLDTTTQLRQWSGHHVMARSQPSAAAFKHRHLSKFCQTKVKSLQLRTWYGSMLLFQAVCPPLHTIGLCWFPQVPGAAAQAVKGVWSQRKTQQTHCQLAITLVHLAVSLMPPASSWALSHWGAFMRQLLAEATPARCSTAAAACCLGRPGRQAHSQGASVGACHDGGLFVCCC